MKFFHKSNKILTVLVISVFFVSCKESIKEQYASQIIKLNPAKTELIRFSQLFSSVEVFTFNNDNDVVYARPTKIIVKNNLFYMLASKMILVWNVNGELLLSISRIGNGPGEYIGINDFLVEDNGYIIVNDNGGKKMIRYNEQGEYVNTINHKLNSNNFTKIKNEFYINSGDLGGAQTEYKINVWDETKSIITNRYIKKGKESWYFGVLEYTNFSFFDDTLSYSQAFSNIIYQLTDKAAIPRLVIDFGNNNLPKGYAEEFNDMISFMESFRSSNYASYIDDYLEGNNYLFLAYSCHGKKPFLFLSKEDNVAHHFDKFEDDFLFPGVIQNTGYLFLPVFMDENALYFSIDAYRFIELYDSIKNSDDQKWENQTLMKSIYDQIDENSNSLIIRYIIKK